MLQLVEVLNFCLLLVFHQFRLKKNLSFRVDHYFLTDIWHKPSMSISFKTVHRAFKEVLVKLLATF